MTAYYNEWERYPAAWIRNLIAAGHVADGVVDERSIIELGADELVGYEQAHFFAGIAGWSYALRLAGWPDGEPVWTGSCPCQPFSAAGKGLGFDDARHLWPVWFGFIRECRPRVIFGEQVASPAGRAWFDAVSADLEGAGYAVGSANLCAAGVGAAHIRQRLYFVAVADSDGAQAAGNGEAGERMADADDIGRRPRRASDPNGLGTIELARHGEGGRMGDADRESSGRNGRAVPCEEGGARRMRAVDHGPRAASDDALSAWADAEWIACTDGKSRPAQPGSFPLAHGVPARVGKLRAYGNAIVPQVAAIWIRSVMAELGMVAA